MRKFKPTPLARLLPVALATLLATPSQADTGIGVDTWLGNKLDPTGGAAMQTPDWRGTTWLEPGEHRSPTGNLYMCPAPTQPERELDKLWRFHGRMQIGWLQPAGDDRNAMWNRFVDWKEGPTIGFDLNWLRSADGTYARLRGSRVSDDDEFLQAAFGRLGSYKVRAFMRNMPNVLSSNAKPIWNGIGSNNLTLAGGLTPGASTSAQVAALSAATPEQRLKVSRNKLGIGASAYLTPRWTAFFDATHEQRKGERPFGGPFFFGNVLETVRPIDDSTTNINAGIRYAGQDWRLDLAYSGSFYRDSDTRFLFETPFGVSATAPITTGQFAMEPDNDYHNLRATVTRKLPLNGELSLTASAGRMRQDDSLIAPISCQGVFGVAVDPSQGPGPANPNLHRCSDWNTSAALSRQTADMQIDTTLFDGRIVLQPVSDITVRGGVRFNRLDYRNVYLAYNPLTGRYGYPAENGAGNSNGAGSPVGWGPGALSTVTRVRSLPLDLQTLEANFGGDWKITDRNTIGATYTYLRTDRTNRERERTDANSIKLTWVNRSKDWLTFRANYTFLHQDGDTYNSNPYEFTLSPSLPGFVDPAGGVPAHTVSDLRKYDVGDRDQNKLNLMATLMPRYDMTVTASLRGDWNDYGTEIGRERMDTWGAILQWDWQPTPETSASIYYGYDRTKLGLAAANDDTANLTPDAALGGPTYPYSSRWWANDRQRNHSAGASFAQQLRRVRVDGAWNYLYSRGLTGISYAGAGALAVPADASPSGSDEFPAMSYWVNSFTVGVTVPLTERISVRVFDYYEIGKINDWHYLGFDSSRVYGNRVYTDGGPQSYRANLVGILFNIQL